jgi:3-deoxy-D-manno-octulosonic-acid transferase
MLSRLIYAALWHLALPAIGVRLLWRARRQPAYLAHLPERLGLYARHMAPGPIWLHAVSVGETRAAAGLVAALLARNPDSQLLITHMTPTGRATAAEVFAHYGERVQSVYLPYDLGWAAHRFLRHFRPACGLFMETEVWPTMLAACRETGVPVALVNARLSERSERGYHRLGGLAQTAFASFDAVGAQTEQDASRLLACGARRVTVSGNLKFEIPPPADASALAARFRSLAGGRPIVLAASTRDGEEEEIIDSFLRLAPAEGLLAIVPRHPQRFGDVGALARQLAGKVQTRSSGAAIGADTRIWLGDSMGEMFAYYAAADVALIGGSWKPFGGQNLIESCAMGCPVIVGPHTFNFAEVANAAVRAGAALRAENVESGMKMALALLAAPERRAETGEAGKAFVAAHRGATARTLAIVDALLETTTAQAAR